MNMSYRGFFLAITSPFLLFHVNPNFIIKEKLFVREIFPPELGLSSAPPEFA